MSRIGKKNSPSPLKKLHWWLLHNGPRRHVTVDTRNGRISFDSTDNCVGKHVFFRREYDVDKVERFIGLLDAGDFIDRADPGLVLNVGANIGLLATALKLYSVFDSVIAFEPVPSNFELLKKNVIQNGMERDIECVNIALSSADGEIEMELSEENYGDHRVRRTSDNGAFGESERKTLRVPMNRLDTFMKRYHEHDRAGLIWMDIQGHEGEFFAGAGELIVRDRVPVVTEFWPYGIERSGISRARYCELVASMFTHFYDRDELKLHGIDEIGGLFEQYAGADVGTDIILVNTAWKKSTA